MTIEYKLLKENDLAIPAIFSLRVELISQCSEIKEITRANVVKAFGGEYLKDILKQLNFSGDTMHGLDSLVEDILVSISPAFENYNPELKREKCKFLSATCIKSDKTKKEYHGRKICDNKDYTADCNRLYLKIL